MSFKAQVYEDIKNVFLNVSEFAENNIINGISIPSILDETSYQEYKTSMQLDTDGVFMQLVNLFVKKDDLNYVPVINEQMNINKSKYFVIATTEVMGILDIKLREYIA